MASRPAPTSTRSTTFAARSSSTAPIRARSRHGPSSSAIIGRSSSSRSSNWSRASARNRLAPMAKRRTTRPEGGKTSGKKRSAGPLINVRHMMKRDIGNVWEFLKLSFREVNAETVEYQRPRSRRRFEEVFDEEGTEQLLFEVEEDIVAYAEASYEVT